MHDSFEKKVQKKMEELSLTPSAPVWEKVEMEIKPEKKKKRAFFWIPFLGLLLAGGYAAYILFNDKKEAQVSSTFLPSKNIDNDESTITKQHIGLTDTFKTNSSPKTIIKKQVDKNLFPKKEKDIRQVKPKPDFKKQNATTLSIA